jgi:hypothetical protein
VRRNQHKRSEDRRDPGRAPLPAEHPELNDSKREDEACPGRDSPESNTPEKDTPL